MSPETEFDGELLLGREIERVLVVRLDNIGDVIMLSPALRTLRFAFPRARITLLASPAGNQVAPMLPWVDEVLTRRVVWQDASGAMPFDPAREMDLVEEIRARRFDAAFIFTSFSQSPWPPAYACYLAGVPLRYGQSKEFGGSLLTRWVKSVPDEVHQTERSLFLLESLGLPAHGRHLELAVPVEARMSAERLLRNVGVDSAAPFAVLAPGASCQARRYDPARFAEVARLLVRNAGLPLVVVGSEREANLAAPLLEAAGSLAASLVGRTSIPELAAVIERCALLIANDSGPMHMADAFLRPIVILYSGTEYESQWRPRYAPTVLLRRHTACSPCYNFRCPFNMECLDIPPEEVAEAASRLLAQTLPGAPGHAFGVRSYPEVAIHPSDL